MQAFRWQNSIQKCKQPFLFHTNTMALHHTLWLGSDGTRFQHFLQVIPYLLNQWWWNSSKLFFKGSIISYFYYYMFCGNVYSLTLLDPTRTHHGIQPGAGKLHLPALGSKNPGCLSPIYGIVSHIFASLSA